MEIKIIATHRNIILINGASNIKSIKNQISSDISASELNIMSSVSIFIKYFKAKLYKYKIYSSK